MLAVSDEQLIQWVADGDPSCLGTLFERHHRGVYRYLLTLTHNNTVSEDLVQDVFIKLLKNARSFRGEGGFKAWLYRMARNAAFDQLRKSKRRGDLHPPGEVALDQLIDHHATETTVSNKQHLQIVATALAQIPAAAREVIWLGRFVFDNYEDLGKALDCNAGAARVRMHRAMQQLNNTLIQLNGEPIDV